MIAFSSLTSSYQPFQPSKKETVPGQLRLTQPSLIPDLIWLANDIETNPGRAVVDNIDCSTTICAPCVQRSAVFNFEQTFANPQETTKPTRNLLYMRALIRELITAKYWFPQTSKEIQVQELLIPLKLLLHRTVKVMLRFLVH